MILLLRGTTFPLDPSFVVMDSSFDMMDPSFVVMDSSFDMMDPSFVIINLFY